MRIICSALLVLLLYHSVCDANVWLKKRKTHKCKSMKGAALQRVYDQLNMNNPSSVNNFRNNLLKPILRVRVPDTEGNRIVQNHLRTKLSLPGWTVEDDSFGQNTVVGYKNFNNIIAKFNPTAERFLTLACHHDSKLLNNFIGATDSAVPCAILLEVAISLTPKLQEKQNSRGGMGEVGLQLIFFDGEEAFQRWTRQDSIYGAKHLAAKLEDQKTRVEREIEVNGIEQMDLMVLLDLIGAGDSKFHNWFPGQSGPAFERMQNIERRLRQSGLLNPHRFQNYFQSSRAPGTGIEDDHLPFKDRDVPVLHMIAYPFPTVWHTVNDDERIVKNTEICDISLIVKVFVCEYLHLQC